MLGIRLMSGRQHLFVVNKARFFFANRLVRFLYDPLFQLTLSLSRWPLSAGEYTPSQPSCSATVGLIKRRCHLSIGAKGATCGHHSDFRQLLTSRAFAVNSSISSYSASSFQVNVAKITVDLLEALVENRQRLEGILRILVQGPCLVVRLRLAVVG